jgi:pseudouridine-5'-phosphate glycosidase
VSGAAPTGPRGLRVGAEVAAGLAARRPVVALESTVITHGLPYPANLDAAQRLEAAVRAEGALPATVGVVGGNLAVGLAADELERLARGPAEKIQARSLALSLARGVDGGTTVSATMRAAASAGIRLFATGGIGGVHRDVNDTLDISEDLEELRRSPVAVVSAGAKAILDLPRTLERLETLGVPVLGHACDELPAFYTRRSGLPVPRLEGPRELAAVLRAHWEGLGERGGVLIVNPPPAEHELAAEEVERWIAHALETALKRGVRGGALTPFLLRELDRLSGGASVRCNVALLEANARLAARIAIALAAND